MSHQFYTRFKNLVTNQIRQAKINYFACNVQQFKRDCKSTWTQINSSIRPNRINKRNIINEISKNYITYGTKRDIGNELNSYFVNINKCISESMNAGPYDHYKYLKGNYANWLFFIIIIIKKGQQCKAEREWCGVLWSWGSKTPAPQYQPIDRKKRKGKRVEDYRRDIAA